MSQQCNLFDLKITHRKLALAKSNVRSVTFIFIVISVIETGLTIRLMLVSTGSIALK